MKVLIVDDEPEHLSTVEALLKQRGYIVVLAADGREGFEKAVETRPDLIIMDIMMPVMDGTEAAAHIRSHPVIKNTPIIFVTAAISAEEKTSLGESQNLIFPKPVKFSELLDAIRRFENGKKF